MQNRKTTKPNGLDTFVKKFASLPPGVDLIVAVTLLGFAAVAIFADNEKAIGITCVLIALLFAFLGVNAISREMKNFKIISSRPTIDSLRSMKTNEFEKYLIALYTLDGYSVRSGQDELHRLDDADLIATRKKETVLIQFNHWDEEKIDLRAIQSLHKAASIMRADRAIAVTLGRYTPEASAWAARKGVELVTGDTIMDTARRLTGLAEAASTTEGAIQGDDVQQRSLEKAPTPLIFVDFAALGSGIGRFRALMASYPHYRIIPSTIPSQMTADDLRQSLGEIGNQLGELLPNASDGRYAAIQRYLSESANIAGCTKWIAIDAHVPQFPEGCSELVPLNRTFGFDEASGQRLKLRLAAP